MKTFKKDGTPGTTSFNQKENKIHFAHIYSQLIEKKKQQAKTI